MTKFAICRWKKHRHHWIGIVSGSGNYYKIRKTNNNIFSWFMERE